MKYIVLNKEQIKLLKGREFAPDSIFGIFVDNYGNSCITDFEADRVTNPEFAWLAQLPRVEPDSLKEDHLTEEQYYDKEIAASQARTAELTAKKEDIKKPKS